MKWIFDLSQAPLWSFYNPWNNEIPLRLWAFLKTRRQIIGFLDMAAIICCSYLRTPLADEMSYYGLAAAFITNKPRKSCSATVNDGSIKPTFQNIIKSFLLKIISLKSTMHGECLIFPRLVDQLGLNCDSDLIARVRLVHIFTICTFHWFDFPPP
jgi:hypothetical protein